MVKVSREQVAEWNPEALLADGFEDALIGVVQRCGTNPLALYSYSKCVEILMDRDEMDYEGAVEYMGYNVLGAYMGENTPMFMMDEID
jgi:hypothetical protein